MPKVVKIALISFASILVIALLAFVVLQTSWFKNYAVDKATEYLSEELNTEVSIGDVSINYFDRLEAHDVVLKDQTGQDMFFIKHLTANYDLVKLYNGEIKIDEVIIDGANVVIGNRQGDKYLNLQFLISYFTVPIDTTKPYVPQQTVFDKITLKNTRFNYFNENIDSSIYRTFNENNIVFTGINGHLHDFIITDDSLNFIIDDLQLTEQSGFEIKEMNALAIISPKLFEFNELVLKTNKSVITDRLIFKQNSYNDFSDFIAKVDIDADFNNTVVHSDDLAYFSTSLNDFNEIFYLNGNVTGYVENLKSDFIDLGISNHTKYKGSARVRNLPDVDAMVLDLNAKTFTTHADAIAKLGELDNPPKELMKLGQIGYKGKFKGTITDFRVNGDLSTDLGIVSADMHLIHPERMDAEYDGRLSSEGFNLKMLTEDDLLGNTQFDFTIKGQGFDTKDLVADFEGSVQEFYYDGYTYTNMNLGGKFTDATYAGMFNINDVNYVLAFDGMAGVKDGMLDLNISTEVIKLNLKELGLDSVDSYVELKGKIDAKGKTLDDIVGDIDLNSVRLKRLDKDFNLKNVSLKSTLNQKRSIDFHSEVFDATMSGNFYPSEFTQIVDQILYVIDPLQYSEPEDTLMSKDIELDLHVNQRHPLIQTLVPDLSFDTVHSIITYDAQISKLTGNTTISKFNFNDISSPMIALKFKNSSLNTPINYTLLTEGLYSQDSILFNTLNINGFIKNGMLNFETTASKDTSMDIELIGHLLYEHDSLKLYLDNSDIAIFDENWNLRTDDRASLIYSNDQLDIFDIDLRNKNQILYFSGSQGTVQKMTLTLINFALNNINPFISGQGFEVDGVVNGNIDVLDRDGYPIIETDGLSIENLMLDDDTLGQLTLKSQTNPAELLKVEINGSIEDGLLNQMKVVGEIDFTNTASPLDLHLKTTRSNIKPFEKFLVGLASNVKGFSTTDISIKGPLNRPKLKGTMEIDSLDFVLDYLKTRYTGNALVSIDKDNFTLTAGQLVDKNGNRALVSGVISHYNFTNYQFNIGIEDLKNFEIMNTTRKDNDLFYGQAFVDGNLKILGPLDDIVLRINAKTRPNTKIFIPLDYFEAGGNLSYVTFVDFDADPNGFKEKFQTSAGVSMDFNFEVTNDANIVLVFDELVGDKIDAVAHGNLRMEVNTYGDFNMYGGLTIDKGDYLFTAFDFLNKDFEVEPGGTLQWDGNPYNATIDLDAVSRVTTVPENLLSESNSDQYTDPLAVDVHLLLKGLLFNPDVTFDLTFPGQTSLSSAANSELSTVIDRIKTDQEEIDRQVFALLALGTFIPPSFAQTSSTGGYSAGDGVKNTTWNSLSDFASNQLTNLISQLGMENLQLGVDWQRDAVANRDEIITTAKYKWKKIEVNGSVDLSGGNTSTPYDLSIEYKFREDGNIRFIGFAKNANDPTIGNLQTTQGVGFYYRYQFDHFFRKKKKTKTKDQASNN